MKNIAIIILSIVLTHFRLSPASVQYAAITNETILDREAAPAEMVDIIELPEIIIEAPAPTPEKNTRTATLEKEKTTFKARKSVDIHSVQNTLNRQFHQELEKTERMILAENLQFHFDEFDLKDNEDFNRILSMADELIFNPELKLSLSGNADNIGTDYYNDVLSYNRVENVKAYLLELGVSADQITVSFNGESNPVADNDTEDGRAENRRVEMLLYR